MTENKKLVKMTVEERKKYNEKMAELRKTPEFFQETATKRVRKVLSALKTLGFMGKYNGSDLEKDKVVEAVEKGFEDMKASMYQKSKDKQEFSL